jgi:hypothetical protein
MPKIQLCTRGDDAGCCVAANRAVEQAAKFGILKNLSVMVPGPAFEDAAARLRDIKNVSLGLHVTLNSEWERVRWGPVLSAAKVPALVDSSGYFTPTPKHLNDREPPLEQMVAEVRAQLHKARAAGMRIDYIDEHMGVGWVRGLRQEIIQLADREGLRFKESLPSLRIELLPFEGRLQRLEAALATAQPGAYVMVTHPMFDDADARAMLEGVRDKQRFLDERESDRKFWIEPAFADVLRANDAVATRFIDL